MARALASLLIVALSSPPIAAADKKACVAAHESAQTDRKMGKLLAARSSLAICANDGCPGPVRADCTKWLGEVEAAIPTIVVRAPEGATATLDDAPLTIDGLPVRVDPGKHVVVVTRPDGTSRTTSVVIAEGEHDRVVTVELEPPPAPPPPKKSVVPWVLGGVGVLGLAGFTVVGLTTNARVRELEDTCAPRCDPSDKEAVERRYLVGDILLGVGVVALGAAATIYVLDRRAPVTTTVSSLPGGAFARLQVAF